MYATRLAAACRRHPRFKRPGQSRRLSRRSASAPPSTTSARWGSKTPFSSSRDASPTRSTPGCRSIRGSAESASSRSSPASASPASSAWPATSLSITTNGGTARVTRTDQKEDEIPLAARIVAIADVYDALSSKRIYKDAYPARRGASREDRPRAAGSQFDPLLVEVFLGIQGSFRRSPRLLRGEETGETVSHPAGSPLTAGKADGPVLSPDQERILVGLMAQNRPPREAVGT